MSNYAVNSPFERDSSSAGLTRLRRDAIAYIDVKLSGAGDASAGQDPAAGMGAAWAAARAANETEDESEKDKFGRDARGARKSSREVGSCVEIKILRRISGPRRNHDLHAIDATPARRDASMAASLPRNDLVKNHWVHPTHWLISTQVGKIESDSEKEEKAKFASRKSGTRIAEVEKRPVVARAQTVWKSTCRWRRASEI